MISGDKPVWPLLDVLDVVVGDTAAPSLAHAMSRCTLQNERWLSSKKAVSTKWMTAFPAGAAYVQHGNVDMNKTFDSQALHRDEGRLYASEQAEHWETLEAYMIHCVAEANGSGMAYTRPTSSSHLL
jgi:hypothetical protein